MRTFQFKGRWAVTLMVVITAWAGFYLGCCRSGISWMIRQHRSSTIEEKACSEGSAGVLR